MELFPFFQPVKGRTFVVVGTGQVAAEKAKRLEMFNCAVRTEKEYTPDCLDGADFCVSAFADRQLNMRVAEECNKRGIPINVADDPQLCDFVFPAIVKKGDLICAVSTQGKSPAYAAQLRAQIEAMVPENIDEILDSMGEIRQEVRERVGGQRKRKKVYQHLLKAMLADEELTVDQAVERVEKAAGQPQGGCEDES